MTSSSRRMERPSVPTSIAIRHEIRLRLDTADLGVVNVRVEGEVATLSGTVRDDRARTHAVAIAWAEPGVRGVEDMLLVDDPMLAIRQTEATDRESRRGCSTRGPGPQDAGTADPPGMMPADQHSR